MIDFVIERHEFWWNYLLENAKYPENFNRKLPVIKWNDRKSGTAGWANYAYCKYNLHYVLSEGENYDDTIAHELCHVFDRRLMAVVKTIRPVRDGHGGLWAYLYNVVCKVERGKYHSYDAPKVDEQIKQLRKLRKLQQRLNALAAETSSDNG